VKPTLSSSLTNCHTMGVDSIVFKASALHADEAGMEAAVKVVLGKMLATMKAAFKAA
jgi:hypothetical protein